jgi:hypothetical protein
MNTPDHQTDNNTPDIQPPQRINRVCASGPEIIDGLCAEAISSIKASVDALHEWNEHDGITRTQSLQATDAIIRDELLRIREASSGVTLRRQQTRAVLAVFRWWYEQISTCNVQALSSDDLNHDEEAIRWLRLVIR